MSSEVRELTGLVDGSRVLIDANVFIFAFTEQSTQCRWLLDQCTSERITGFTTVEIINEVCHRLMITEAVTAGVIERPSALSLKRKPNHVKNLTRYWHLSESIFRMNLVIVPLNESRLRHAHRIRIEYGLLTTDSMLIAAAREYGIVSPASHDSDFERIDRLVVYKPSDI